MSWTPGRSIAPHLQRGTLVVLESTTYPGTTDEDLRAGAGGRLGLKAGVDFHLAFSPEREDPGNPESKVETVPKVVGGYTPACLERAVALYGKAIKTLVPVSSCRVAEATKLLENIFRSVNIALVNELKLVYEAMGIDIWEVIDAAKTKPFGFMPFYPGPGLGGHCIPIDPFYLTWKAREYRPEHALHRAGRRDQHLHARARGASRGRSAQLSTKASQLLADPDSRPGLQTERRRRTRVAQLRADGSSERNAAPWWSITIPTSPVIKPTREHSHWAGKESVMGRGQTIQEFRPRADRDQSRLYQLPGAGRLGAAASWIRVMPWRPRMFLPAKFGRREGPEDGGRR